MEKWLENKSKKNQKISIFFYKFFAENFPFFWGFWFPEWSYKTPKN